MARKITKGIRPRPGSWQIRTRQTGLGIGKFPMFRLVDNNADECLRVLGGPDYPSALCGVEGVESPGETYAERCPSAQVGCVMARVQ